MKKWLVCCMVLLFHAPSFSQMKVEINNQSFVMEGELIQQFPFNYCTYIPSTDSAKVENEDGTFHYRAYDGVPDTAATYILLKNDSLFYQSYSSCSGFEILSIQKIYLKSGTLKYRMDKITNEENGIKTEYWQIELAEEMTDYYMIQTDFEESVGDAPWLVMYFTDKKQAKKYFNLIKKGK